MRQAEGCRGGAVTAVFPTELGWMAGVWRHGRLTWLVFGCESAAAALEGVDVDVPSPNSTVREMDSIITRLQRYARGERVDFRDVLLDLDDRTAFQRTVLNRCRQIPFGHVMSYGQLAAKAGYPRSARAVGNVMAHNRTPLIVPCHRVVGSGGALGGFSAPQGIYMKQRLLQLEGTPLPPKILPGVRAGV